MVTQIPLNKLELSTLNVRQVVDDGGTADLEASIMSHGLMSALTVHTIVASPKTKQKFGVLAGGRRLRALQALAARGEVAKDHPVDCVIRDENAETQIELSVIENTARVNLTPVEEFAAFARLHAEDPAMDAAAIARRFGTTELHVRQRMALGALHPEILAALGTGKISLDAAKAYAATADHGLQMRVFEFNSKGSYGSHHAYSVRQLIKRGESAYDLAAMIKYVGRDAYVAAGGVLEVDLFQPDEPRILHPGTLADLYYAKLEAEKAALAAKLPDVEIVTDVDNDSWRRRIQMEPRLDDAADARRRAIDTEAEAISARLEEIATPSDPAFIGDDLTDADLVADEAADQPVVEELLAQLAALTEESETLLKSAPLALPDGPIVAKVEPSAEGLKVVGYYRPAGYVEGAPVGETTTASPAAPSTRELHGLSDAAVEVMAAHRRAILRAQMVSRDMSDQRAPGLYLAFAILRMTVPKFGDANHAYCTTVGLADGVRAATDSAAAGPEVSSSRAAALYGAAVEETREQEWMTAADMQVAFATFCELPVEDLYHYQAVAAAQLLGTSLAVAGRACPLHDQLAYAMGVEDGAETRRVWSPDEAFFAKLSKPHRLAAVADISPRIADKLKSLKDRPLSAACARIFSADPDTVREYDMLPGQIHHARRWVPAALAFDDQTRGPTLMETALDSDAAEKPRRELDAADARRKEAA